MAYSARKIAFMGLMLALMLVLIAIERAMPSLPLLPPHLGRIGLPNVIVMYVLFFVGKKEAVTIAVLKAGFNVLMRGPLAGLLSLSGGLLSLIIILVLWWVFGDKISYVALSIGGAIGHNAGQLAAFSIVFQSWSFFMFYSPVLLISGAIFGTVTGVFLRVIMPVFDRVYKRVDDDYRF